MNNNETTITGLRDLANFLEASPTLPRISAAASVWIFFDDKENLLASAAGHGQWEKNAGGDHFWLSKKFGPVELQLNIKRELICERVVITETLPARPETILPAQPERTVEKVEWKCPDSLLRAAS